MFQVVHLSAIQTSSLSAQAGSSPHLTNSPTGANWTNTEQAHHGHQLQSKLATTTLIGCISALTIVGLDQVVGLSGPCACISPSQPRRRHASAHEDRFHLALSITKSFQSANDPVLTAGLFSEQTKQPRLLQQSNTPFPIAYYF